MNFLTVDEHRVLFHGLRNLPVENIGNGIPSRAVLESNRVDIRLFVKWWANRPQKCPSCGMADNWSVGGEEDVPYSCMTCFTDVFLEKSISNVTGDFEDEDEPRDQRFQRKDDETQCTEVDFVDLFFRLDEVARAFTGSAFAKKHIPGFTSVAGNAFHIPWEIFADVANAFTTICRLKNIADVECDIDSPHAWWCFYFVVRDVCSLSLDMLRRLIPFARIYVDSHLQLSASEPFLVTSLRETVQPPTPLLYWLYQAQTTHNSISVHDMHMFLPLELRAESSGVPEIRGVFRRRTEDANMQKILSFCRILGLDKWIPSLQNPKCIDLMHDVLYFLSYPGRYIAEIPSITGDALVRPFAHLDITEEQMHCCFLLVFFQRIRSFASTTSSSSIYDELASWIKDWYDSHGQTVESQFQPQISCEVFIEPYLTHLLHIFAIVSCTPVHRILYFIQLVARHAHGVIDEAYASDLVVRIDRYFGSQQTQPSREYGIAEGPAVFLSHILSDTKSLGGLTDALFNEALWTSVDIQKSPDHIDAYILQNAFREEPFLLKRNSKERSVNTVQSSAFVRDGLHTRNPATLSLLFFNDKRFNKNVQMDELVNLMTRNRKLIGQIGALSKEIVFSHYYKLEVSGLPNLGTLVFLQIPTCFTKANAFLRKMLTEPFDPDACRCGYMVCYRSVYPSTNYIIAWFFFEEQWKILQVNDRADRLLKGRTALPLHSHAPELPSSFALCPHCESMRIQSRNLVTPFDSEYIAQFVFSREFTILATSLGRYNANSIHLELGGTFSDALSFPMFRVTSAERWDIRDIRIVAKGEVSHRHYPPFPEVLFPITFTDVFTARQRIIEWAAFCFREVDASFNGFNLPTKGALDYFKRAQLDVPAAIVRARNLDAQSAVFREKLAAEKNRSPGPPFLLINRIFQSRAKEGADVGQRIHWVQRIARDRGNEDELLQFYERFAQWMILCGKFMKEQ